LELTTDAVDICTFISKSVTPIYAKFLGFRKDLRAKPIGSYLWGVVVSPKKMKRGKSNRGATYEGALKVLAREMEEINACPTKVTNASTGIKSPLRVYLMSVCNDLQVRAGRVKRMLVYLLLC
jgi:hypothetical protein